MPRLELTKPELATLKEALETYNDMSNDMLFEDLSVNLFPRGGKSTTIDSRQATQLRKELSEAFDKMMNLRTLLYKVGTKVNEAGYTV